jgi:hypothetical protein
MIGSILSLAICYATMSGVILTYPNFAIPGKLINMTFSEVIRGVSGIFACAFLMSAAVYFLGKALPAAWPHWARLTLLVVFGGFFYFALIHLFSLAAYLEVKQIIAERWPRRFPQKEQL